MELQLPTDTGNQLISFNVAALQSMMQAVAREVAEKVNKATAERRRYAKPISNPLLCSLLCLQICIEGPTGIKLRDCADKVIGLKQELTVMKQSMRAQASTQDSLRVAVSHLDKQVQVLPSTLAKQLANPPEQHEALPKTKSEAAAAQQQQQAQQGEVAEKQLTSWSQALEQQSDSEATMAARAAFLQQGPQVPLSRQLMEDNSQKPAVAPAPASHTQQQQQQSQPAVPASAGEPAAPQVTVVQVMLLPFSFLGWLDSFLRQAPTPWAEAFLQCALYQAQVTWPAVGVACVSQSC